jgi:ATP-dependent Clp protease ATP-binding subunit ClpC
VFAELLFGSADRLVRLDMSEFQTPESLERLLADSTSAGQAAPLVSAVRRDPFAVVLLDEFEKAHANVWDVFLQVFDDGRLTDVQGRTVDFRHCVIVLTSNVGSALPTVAGPGFTHTPATEAFTRAGVERAVARTFRPELLNRLDRVADFTPLGRDAMRSVLRNELNAVLERRGFRIRPWAVEWDRARSSSCSRRGSAPSSARVR